MQTSKLAPNYNPLPVKIATAEGEWVTDIGGRRYYDALAGYSSLNFGHRHPALIQAVKDQMDRVTLVSRAFDFELLEPFADALADLCGMDMVLPMNTGAEAVETAIKAARKWGHDVKGIENSQSLIIVAEKNFHGRTTTIVSFSCDDVARDSFGPFSPGFLAVPYGDTEALAKAIEDNADRLAAVLLEPIQGESGVVIPPDEYLRAARDLTEKANVLLILDEIQSGLGRTGYTFAWERVGVKPDLMTLGKALGGGIFPVSACVGKKEVMQLMGPGTHGSTFGGNPIACAVGIAACKMLATGEYQSRARELGEHFQSRLEDMVRAGLLLRKRGVGMWAGIDIDPDRATGRAVCELLMDKGVLAKDTHGSTVRFAPPLSTSKEDLDWMLDQLEAVLKEIHP
ncbi:MAG: ornithine--oxo-acid transaminase [Coriobacteriia bacterium]|nr:ornithine--oxo-acid transaminase [Coriobacteriia bacterium]MCL2746136.1 ornithine--oxo-acid transaminase [Coriobacteriia bacterium]MCL2871178.1 ornithine--oxo-acid transaminase [Coriobacteriia bacterium]